MKSIITEMGEIKKFAGLTPYVEEVVVSEAKLGKADLAKPWTINGSQWLTINKIKEPWIAEISPMQYARMSKSAKVAYDKKRHKEWSDAAKGKKAWADAVYAAYKAGEFDIKDKGVHSEAKSAALQGQIASDKAEKEKLLDQAMKDNQITDASGLKKGDTVYSVMARDYAEVLKVSKKSARISSRYDPKGIKQGLKALQWLSYDDLRKKILGESDETRTSMRGLIERLR